ncbi:MAG: MFS transporter [Syntrophales bacterium]
MEQTHHPPASLAWLVWGLGAAFYFSGFYHRVAPAVMTDQLMADFQIGAAALGNFTAFYFYSYSLMQIPTGLLADHWGPRKLLTAGAFVAAAGTILFASASSLAPANLGRFLIGGAAGIGYVAVLTLATRWFPVRFFATLSGLALFCGVAGAVSAGPPLRFLVERFGWRPVMFAVAAALVLLGAAIWRIVSDDPSRKGYLSFAPSRPETTVSPAALLADLATVLRERNIRWLALAGCGLTGPVLAFAGLWGVPFLTTHHGISAAASSAITSTLLICYALGSIALGMLSDRIGLRKPLLVAGALTATVAWVPILFFPGIPLWLLILLVIVAGLANGSVILGFAFGKESVPPRFAGTASGIYNMGSTFGTIILQPAIGWLLDRNWQGGLAGGVRIYDAAAYRTGFILIVALAALSVLAAALTSETHCRQKPDDPA